MMRVVMLTFALTIAAAPVMAHHSAAAEYEGKTSVIEGTVTRFEWMNPHVWIYLDVKGSGGELIHMKCEGNAPSGLIENGWSRDSLKPGDGITIEGYRAKGRRDGFKARIVTLPDGHRLVMGLPLDGGK